MTFLSSVKELVLRRSYAVRSDGEQGPLESAIPIDPAAIFSPDPEQVAAFKRFDERAARKIELRRTREPELRAQQTVLFKGIPYSQYLDEWRFHPGRIGGFLTRSENLKLAARTARKVRKRFVDLPNGGLALYYPNTIRTARLQTNEPIYSGIAQGQLLAGYLRLMRNRVRAKGAAEWPDIALRIAKSMMFPFEQGGICVDDSIILEASNFRACPETILNGWIDALIHLHDYLIAFPNTELESFYARSIERLAEMLPLFDDETARLSLYSNLCPYTFRVHLHGERGPVTPRVRVEYIPTRSRHNAYCIENLWAANPAELNCIYENKIGETRARSLDLSLSVTSLYDLKIYVEADCARIAFDPGTYNETSTVPRRTFLNRSVLPAEKFTGRHTTFVIRASELGLMAGCPTNFLKAGHNFYHMYHVVSLYDLALTTKAAGPRKAITDMAARWFDYTQDPKHARADGRSAFSNPEKLARNITRFRGASMHHTFAELRERATGVF